MNGPAQITEPAQLNEPAPTNRAADRPFHIGFFGEVMLEFCTTPVQAAGGAGFGGDTLNSAFYLQQLLLQAGLTRKVSYFTAVGSDASSQQLAATLAATGLALPWQTDASRALGCYWISTDANGERSFRYQRSDSAVRAYFAGAAPTALELALTGALDALDCCYLSGISLAVLPEPARERLFAALQQFCARGGWLVYDNNFRPQLWDAATALRWQQRLLSLCWLALLTDHDERLLWQQLAAPVSALLAQAERLLSPGALLVIKCGAEPAWLSGPCTVAGTAANHSPVGAARWQQQVAAVPVAQVVDSSGAGDAFAAAFLARLLCELTTTAAMNASIFCDAGQPRLLVSAGLARQAAVAGHQLASVVVQQPGAIVARLPDLRALFTKTPAEAT